MQEYLKKITNKIGDHKLKLLLFLSWVGFFIIYFIPFFSEGIGYFLRLFFILLPALIISTGRTDLFFRSFRSWLPWGVIAIQVFCLGYNVYAEYYSLNLTYYDTGWFWNTIANFMNGKGFYSSQLGLSELADHFCPGLLTLLPFAYMFPNPVLLIITRLVFFIFSIYTFRRLIIYLNITEGRRNFLILLYVINLGTMGFMGFEFQPSNLMVPFIFLLFEFLLRNRYIPFILTALFVATLKENAGFLIISLGLFQWLYKGKFKSGLFIAFLGGIILLLVSQILIPYFAGEWIQASILDPNCCFPQKIHFVLLVLMCSSFFILLYPKALIVLLPSLLTSLLVGMNKAGAFTIEFHYQDIPLCVSFSLLALELSKNPDILPKYLMPKLELRIVVSIFLMITFTFMTKSSFLFANSHKITKESKDAISALERFQKDYNTDQRDIKIWAQSSLAFNLSSLYNIRCILDANWILADEERNYIILSDASPERWPIYGDYDRLKQTLIDNSEEGSRIAIRGYEPLLIFERKTRR